MALQESPPKPPSPNSDVADANPPSLSEDFSFYSQLVLHIAKAMDLGVQQPTHFGSDKVYDDIDEDQTPPLQMGFILWLLKLIKQSWSKLSSVPQISQRIKNLYKTHGTDTEFLSKHPPPNSMIVDAMQN